MIACLLLQSLNITSITINITIFITIGITTIYIITINFTYTIILISICTSLMLTLIISTTILITITIRVWISSLQLAIAFWWLVKGLLYYFQKLWMVKNSFRPIQQFQLFLAQPIPLEIFSWPFASMNMYVWRYTFTSEKCFIDHLSTTNTCVHLFAKPKSTFLP